MAHASFDGLRVLSLESRRAVEIEKLIRTYGGHPFVVPAMREVKLEGSQAALIFAERLMAGEIDVVILLTGVGTRALLTAVEGQYEREAFLEALRRVKVVTRGPKPEAVLREWKVSSVASAAEPNTWHELMAAIDNYFGDSLKTMRVAVQEYGASNPELLEALTMRSASVLKVPVYQWALPHDLQPLRECVHGLAHAGVDVVVFTTAVQVIHLMMVAQEMDAVEAMRAGMRSLVVVSIGPTTTAELLHHGITPDFEPSRPKMGFLINEAAQYAGKVLEQKRLMPDVPAAENTPVRRVAESTSTLAGFTDGLSSFNFLHEISSRIAASDPLHTVLDRIVEFVTTIIPCDSCFIYVMEDEKLTLRASRNPHADLVGTMRVRLGQGITGWVAEHREPVAIAEKASDDPRFLAFRNLPEDQFEAMLCIPILCANRTVGVINLQHQHSYRHTEVEKRLLTMIGFLVGAEMERARLDSENLQLSDRLETRKVVDRAKGVLQRELGLDEIDAYSMMQQESRQRRRSMREIAEAILMSEDLKRMKGETEPA
jgi:uroporphyrinogen-III synthase